MGLLDKLKSKLAGDAVPSTGPTSTAPPSAPNLSVTISMPGRPQVDAPVTVEDATCATAQYAYVLDNELPALKPADQWWNESTHKRRVREGSKKALEWLEPFVTPTLVESLSLESAKTEWGPMQALAIVKELRAVVRARRKAKEPHEDVMRALYGACLLADFVKALRFEYVQPHHLAQYLAIKDVHSVQLDFTEIGYRQVEAIGPTDIKWLVEAFGEPVRHRPVAEALAPLVQRCISRYCWAELKTATDYGSDRDSMQKWLAWQVSIRLKLAGEDAVYRAEQAARQTAVDDATQQAWAATAAPFVVADLETTGFSAETDEVLEFAALRVAPDGTVTGDFSALVRVEYVPTDITRLTGITQAMVDHEGMSLSSAIAAFAEFIGSLPVFFHNASFDQGFLRRAGVKVGVPLLNPVHDTLPLARQAWPSLSTYKLAALAEHVGAQVPTHRALADARAALAVLLAARSKVGVKG